MTRPPDVTVIVPVYNTVDYLEACLDSLVGQSIAPGRLQVIAVDDGSTDGSGALLDAYAARHPGLVTVLHQANSGGPARPCNLGLDHATGRFVFFLGSDDYLALDSVERMVERADAWDVDVLIPPMEGVNGRFVDQRLFAKEEPDLAFPGGAASYSLSNTKLFRRSLVVEHGIRFSLDLRIGSDQPFTVAAMLRARRIGVLARPTVYFAVKRADDSNITYRSDWRTRLVDLTAVIDKLCELVPAGERRDALLVRHFSWELDKLLTRDLELCAPDDAQALVDALREVAQRLLTEGLRASLSLERRLRWSHVLEGRADLLLRDLADPPEPGPLLFEEAGAFRLRRGFRDGVADWVYAVPDANVAAWVHDIDQAASVELRGHTVVLRATTTEVDPRSAPFLRLALSPLGPDGFPRRALDVPGDRGTRVVASAPMTIDADGSVRAELDLSSYAAAGGGAAGLRLRIVTNDRIIDRPVRVVVDASSEVRGSGWRATIRLSSVKQDRVRVDVVASKTLMGRLRARPGRD